MASTTTTDALTVPASDLIFANTTFWVGHQIPQRSWMVDRMRRHGATIVALESQANVCLIDDAKQLGPYLTGDYFSYKFVEDSIRKGTLQPLGRYRVSASSQTERIQGKKGVMNKRSRNKFTEQDDRILYDTVLPTKNRDGPWRGAAIYKQLEQKYPHHTWQSWRSRFLDHLQYRRSHNNGGSVGTPEPGQMHEELVTDLQRSPKRRRLQEPEEPLALPGPLNADPQKSPQAPTTMSEPVQQLQQLVQQSEVLPSAQFPDNQVYSFEQEATIHALTDVIEDVKIAQTIHSRQSLLADARLKNLVLERGFTLEQANSLYKAVPHIYDTNPVRLDECWNEMATDYDTQPMHSVEEWKLFWYEVIVPAYKRRNNLVDEDDIQKHIRLVLCENRESTPEVKKEPSSTSRTPEDIQRERELESARAEAELQMSSDDEEDEVQNSNDRNRMFMGDKKKRLSSATTVFEQSYLFDPSMSPVMQRDVVTANKDNLGTGRRSIIKGAVPKTTPDIQSSQTSYKKKLFGRSLYPKTAESQNLATQNNQPQVHVEEPLTVQTGTSEVLNSLCDKTNVANGNLRTSTQEQEVTVVVQSLHKGSRRDGESGETKAAKTLPQTRQSADNQEPPESGQRFPKSASTSQSTQRSSDATPVGSVIINPGPDHVKITPHDTNASLPKVADASNTNEENGNICINLVDECADNSDDVHSEKAASDTGSEFMAFDEEPERSQLWATSPFDDTNAEQDGEGRQAVKEKAQSLKDQDQDAHKDPQKVIRNPGPATSFDLAGLKEQPNELQSLVAKSSSTVHISQKVETQALFQMSLQEDPSLLDVPPPEGGWEVLGIDESEHEEVDSDTGTTETTLQSDEDGILSDEDDFLSGEADTLESTELVRKHNSPSSSSNTATLSSMERQRPRSGLRSPRHTNVVDIPSDSSSDTESTVSSIATHSTGNLESSRAAIVRNIDETDTESSVPSDSEDTPPYPKSRISDLHNWFSAQRARYNALPNPVFHRLASAAAQAATLNLPTAALVLRMMTEKFTSSENTRCRQYRERNRPFKPKENLSDEEARQLVPDDTWGVWTIADDKALLSRTVEGVRTVEGKHGVEGTRKRSRFLRARYAVPQAQIGSVGKEVARQAVLEGKGRPKPKAELRDMVI